MVEKIPLRKRWWWPLRMSNWVTVLSLGSYVHFCAAHQHWPPISESKFFVGAVAIACWALRAVEDQSA